MRFLEFVRRGEGAALPLLRPVEDGLGARRALRCWPSWARCVRPLPHLLHPRCARWWGTLFGSPKPFGGKVVDAAFLLAAEDVRHHC